MLFLPFFKLTFYSLNTANGGYLLKLTLYFSKKLTYNQDNAIACALSQYFSIVSSRIYTELAVYCGQTTSLIPVGDSQTSIFSKAAASSNLYPYYFYFLPDLTASSDVTNLEVR